MTVSDEQPLPVDPERLRRLAELVLAGEGYPDGTSVSILLVTDEEIAVHNERHMGRVGPTDVLAFPLEQLEPGVVPPAREGGPPLLLGDVLVAPAIVREQAVRAGIAFDDELALMVVHGILHLMGYDHVDDDEAERMEDREREILGAVGVARS